MKYTIDVSNQKFDLIDFYESQLSFCMPIKVLPLLHFYFQNAIIMDYQKFNLPGLNLNKKECCINGPVELVIVNLNYLLVDQTVWCDFDSAKKEEKFTRQIGCKIEKKFVYSFDTIVDWIPSYASIALQCEKISAIFDVDDIKDC